MKRKIIAEGIILEASIKTIEFENKKQKRQIMTVLLDKTSKKIFSKLALSEKVIIKKQK